MKACQCEPRDKHIKTLLSWSAFLIMGVMTGSLGASLLELQEQTRASTEQIAMLLTWYSAGRLLGVILIGLVFDLVNQMLLLLASLVLGAIASVSIPWCRTYAVLAVPVAISGFSYGTAGGNLNPLLILLWKKKVGPYIQILHFSYALGATAAPLIVKSFLRQDKVLLGNQTVFTYQKEGQEKLNMTSLNKWNAQSRGSVRFQTSTHTYYNWSHESLSTFFKYYSSVPSGLNTTTVSPPVDYGSSAVKWIFVGIGASKFFIAVLVVIHICFYRFSLQPIKYQANRQKHLRSETKRSKFIVFVSFVLTLPVFVVAGGLEVSYGGLILTYTVKLLNWAKSEAALATSLFWGFLAVGRGLGALVTSYHRASVILIVDFSLLFVSALIIALAAPVHTAVVWICTGLFGFALATVLSNGLLLVERFRRVTGRVSSVLITTFSLGMMGLPALCGLLFRRVGEGSFPFVLLGAALLGLTCLVVVLLLLKHGALKKEQAPDVSQISIPLQHT